MKVFSLRDTGHWDHNTFGYRIYLLMVGLKQVHVPTTVYFGCIVIRRSQIENIQSVDPVMVITPRAEHNPHLPSNKDNQVSPQTAWVAGVRGFAT